MGRSSMEILVQVGAEDLSSDRPPVALSIFTMVALDETAVRWRCRLILETDEEKKTFMKEEKDTRRTSGKGG